MRLRGSVRARLLMREGRVLILCEEKRTCSHILSLTIIFIDLSEHLIPHT